MSAAFFISACSALGERAASGNVAHLLDTVLPVTGFLETTPAGDAPDRIRSLIFVRPGANVLSVYIEGDGAAWRSVYAPPADPTPDDGIVSGMALADARRATATNSVAYLARPCQFLDNPSRSRCPVEFWTGQRYSDAVLARMDAQVSRLKALGQASRLELVGFSGGGVIAALLGARRDDVDRVIAVAAPLDLAAWTKHHGLTFLGDSLDPALIRPVRRVPLVAYMGERDRIVPPMLLDSFAAIHGARLVTIPGFDHHCCWVRDWPGLLENAQ